MVEGRYQDATALWAAATDRARNLAAQSGSTASRVLREFVFSRFLARVFHDPSQLWVLKGGQAILARVHDARTSKDIDLLRQSDSIDAALVALRTAMDLDLGDHFRFVITGTKSARGGAAQPGVEGFAVSIDAYCGARKRATFIVDLVTGSLMTTSPDIQEAAVLEIPGLHAPRVRLYPVADHIADKLCATQATYGANNDQPSSRVRDLVDLVVFARTQPVDGARLTAAIQAEWTHRAMAGSPVFEPPSTWQRQYPPLARTVPACEGYETFASAVDLVTALIAPALRREAEGLLWEPTRAGWQPS